VNPSPHSNAPAQRDPSDRKTQRVAILRLLDDAREAWIALPEIMACAAQYNARLFELRRLGFHIENRTERDDAGVVHSWYRLVNSPVTPSRQEEIAAADSKSGSEDWFHEKTGKSRPTNSTPDFGPLFGKADHL
jgi:hypothetical protein